MKKFKIKKGDEVIVIAGKDKGKKGIVSKIITKKDRVLIDGINIVKKHKRSPNPENKKTEYCRRASTFTYFKYYVLLF